MAKARSGRLRLSTEQIANYLQRRPEAQTSELLAALSALSVPGLPQPMGAGGPLVAGAKVRRRGVETGPIIASLVGARSSAKAVVDQGPLTLNVWLEGARVLTVNELFSVLQYRKHETFRYKKAWRGLVARALKQLPSDQRQKLWFDGPTQLTLFRRGKGEIDLDSLSMVFKYAIDTLRREGIIDDDNPETIVEIKLIQTKGAPALGLRVEALPGWVKPDASRVYETWFGESEPPPVSPLGLAQED